MLRISISVRPVAHNYGHRIPPLRFHFYGIHFYQLQLKAKLFIGPYCRPALPTHQSLNSHTTRGTIPLNNLLEPLDMAHAPPKEQSIYFYNLYSMILLSTVYYLPPTLPHNSTPKEQSIYFIIIFNDITFYCILSSPPTSPTTQPRKSSQFIL